MAHALLGLDSEHFLFRREKVVDSKIFGYVWTGHESTYVVLNTCLACENNAFGAEFTGDASTKHQISVNVFIIKTDF